MNPTNQTHQNLSGDNDEISLFDLVKLVLSEKAILLYTVVAFLAMAILYLLIVPPTYEAKISLLAPEVATLSLTTPTVLTRFEPATVFAEFQERLKMIESWQLFVATRPADVQKTLSKEVPFKFTTNKNFSSAHTQITFQYHRADLAASILSDYLTFARQKYIDLLVTRIKYKIENQIKLLANEIDSMRNLAKMSREDKVERIRRDLVLAKNLKIVENAWLYGSAGKTHGDNEDSKVGSISIVATDLAIPGYMRGTKVLGEELNDLLQRKMDDAYISGLRTKEQELNRIKNLQIDSKMFVPYYSDGSILVPEFPIKPVKRITIALATILGLILGSFLAFIKARNKLNAA